MQPPAAAVPEKLQEFHINLGCDVVRRLRHQPGDVRLDDGRAHALEHADPLVPLLDVEPAQVLVALDGVVDTLAELGGAQVDPLHGKLRLRPHQGEEPGGEAVAPGLLRGAHHQVDGYVHYPQLHLGQLELVCPQGLDVGGQPPVDTVFIFPLALLQGRQIVLHRLGAGHKTHSFRWLTACIVSNNTVGCQCLRGFFLVWNAEKRASPVRGFDALPGWGRAGKGGAKKRAVFQWTSGGSGCIIGAPRRRARANA